MSATKPDCWKTSASASTCPPAPSPVSREELIYVSPKSARAVSRDAGLPYKDKLLALPPFLLSSQGGLQPGDVENGLALTGFFLERYVFHPHNKPLPDIRNRLLDTLRSASIL